MSIKAIIDSKNWMYYIKSAADKHGLSNGVVYKALEKDLFGPKEKRDHHLQELLLIVRTAIEMSVRDNVKIVQTQGDVT